MTALGRRELIIVGLLWAAMASVFVTTNLEAIASLDLPDPDDHLRLQQVRDWLAGQGWFDVTQHRINPPAGGEMHWSRLVDIPLAAGIAALTPLLGRTTAEIVVCVTAPMLTMALAMFMVAMITARLVGKAWAPLAAMTVPLSGLTYVQVMPLRIDHHGWQLVLALTLLWALLDETQKRRSGVVAGLAAAFWLNISVEGLPVATCAAAVLGVRWLLDAREAPRLQTFVWTLTLVSFALAAATTPAAWSVPECDRLSQPYFAVFGVAAIAVSAAGHTALARDWRARLGLAAAACLAAAAAFAGSGARCFAGPFADLEPLTRTLWLGNVGESQSLFEKGPRALIEHAGFAALGCAGAALALRSARDETTRLSWATALTLSVFAAALMLALSRTGAVAQAFAAPGAVFLAQALFIRARRVEPMPVRVLATALAIVAGTPAPLRLTVELAAAPAQPQADCSADIAALNGLPASLLFAPPDLGPMIIARTQHSVIATGHHRNHAAINDVVGAFASPLEAARRIVTERKAAYLVICAAIGEMTIYAREAPTGLAAELTAGRAPEWLEPVRLSPRPARLKVYRVRD